ncbi:MAG: protein kinase [Actinobacteria bacterium]|nr:protein kinase [Actinomycetota bacterium]
MEPGDVIQERYELEETLGDGGMAAVWRARDRRLGRDVAVKVLDDRLAHDPEYMVRFFSEAQSVARISHPHVVGILDFGQHDEHPYLVMECVEGGSAADLIGEPILPERAIEIVQEAASAAGAAHAHGIVHRDIKPGNILLTRDGRVRLADFGIATSRGAEPMTATGQAIGSPHYISPEQVSGSSASPASDVYSLGVVLYELLTGRKPFDGTSITQIAISHVESQPEAPSAYVSDLDPGLERLVMRCLSKDPQDRFADGQEVADALAAFAEGTTYRDEEDVGGGMAVWRRPGAIGAAAAALAVLVAAGVLAFGGLERTTPPAQGETTTGTEDQRRKAKPKPAPSAAVDTSDTESPSPSPSPSATDNDTDGDSRSSLPVDSDGSNAEAPVETYPEPEPTPEPTASPTDDGATTDETTSTLSSSTD